MDVRCLAVTDGSDLPETHLLLGLHRSGVALRVLSPASAPNRELLERAGVHVSTLDLRGRFDAAGTATIRKALIEHRANIMHAFNNRQTNNGMRACKGLDVKTVAYRGTVGNLSYWDPVCRGAHLNPRLDAVTCVSNAVRQYMYGLRFLGRPKPVCGAITVYKGHEPEWYDRAEVTLAEQGIPDDAFVVGCTLNDRPHKGVRYLIEAIAQIDPHLPIHWAFMGRMNNKGLLRSIDANPNRARIHLLGYRKDAPAVVRSHDVCVLPAIAREGLPRTIIEGMVQGVVPIVTDVCGSPELVEHGRSGLIVAPRSGPALADAVMRLYREPDALNEMKQAAKHRIATNFNSEQTVQQHLALYQRLLH